MVCCARQGVRKQGPPGDSVGKARKLSTRIHPSRLFRLLGAATIVISCVVIELGHDSVSSTFRLRSDSTTHTRSNQVIVKRGKEVQAAIIASVFVILGAVCLLTPLRDLVTRRGFPMWVLGLVFVFVGCVFWFGVIQNVLRRGRGN